MYFVVLVSAGNKNFEAVSKKKIRSDCLKILVQSSLLTIFLAKNYLEKQTHMVHGRWFKSVLYFIAKLISGYDFV